MLYTVISTDPDELDIRAEHEGREVSTSFMNEQGLFDWYMDAFGGQAAERINVDMIIDSLAGEYVIIEGLTSEDYTAELAF